MKGFLLALATAGGAALAPAPVWAQPVVDAVTSPTSGAKAVSPAVASRFDVDPASVEMPNLAFDETPEDVKNYDKYFYFARPETDFATAYADIRECDGYARGLSYRGDGSINFLAGQYGIVGGVVGGIFGEIAATAERRRMRRLNQRICMYFKGYQRFGLRKVLWSEFNFEDGDPKITENIRQTYLQRQAKVASSPMPQAQELVQ
ncbi:hypothetical protein TPR58_22530 [Sphingomonas sp. HF-S3]|uniref:Uncharacterized protein n=1 Tax=Sphingomonas rustica TaxID=3103142 RepID=A0ABV0BH12_9SPHN